MKFLAFCVQPFGVTSSRWEDLALPVLSFQRGKVRSLSVAGCGDLSNLWLGLYGQILVKWMISG